MRLSPAVNTNVPGNLCRRALTSLTQSNRVRASCRLWHRGNDPQAFRELPDYPFRVVVSLSFRLLGLLLRLQHQLLDRHWRHHRPASHLLLFFLLLFKFLLFLCLLFFLLLLLFLLCLLFFLVFLLFFLSFVVSLFALQSLSGASVLQSIVTITKHVFGTLFFPLAENLRF